jgi:hypothetical protein
MHRMLGLLSIRRTCSHNHVSHDHYKDVNVFSISWIICGKSCLWKKKYVLIVTFPPIYHKF